MRKKIIELKSRILGIIVGLILGTVLSLTGCGSDESTISDDGGRVVEKIDEDGNVISSDEQESISSDSDGEGTNDHAGDAEVPEENEDGSKMVELTEAQQDALRDVESVENGKDYLAYMSEDELRALACEALEAAGKDTRLADGRMKTKGVVFELPEGFEEDSSIKNFFVTSRYPIDASNIIYEETDVDYTLQLMNKEYFADLVKNIFANAYSEDIDINIKEFKELMISGVPSFRLVTEYDLDGNHMIHLMYIINGSKTYCIVYTETAEYDRMELFEESAKTIKVQR